jgi:hypothetical protein
MKTGFFFYLFFLFGKKVNLLTFEDQEISRMTPEVEKDEDSNSVKININLKNDDKKK